MTGTKTDGCIIAGTELKDSDTISARVLKLTKILKDVSAEINALQSIIPNSKKEATEYLKTLEIDNVNYKVAPDPNNGQDPTADLETIEIGGTNYKVGSGASEDKFVTIDTEQTITGKKTFITSIIANKIGNNANASQNYSIAVGDYSRALSSFSTALGYYANASNSVSIGSSSTSKSQGVAIGNSAVAGRSAIAIGNGARENIEYFVSFDSENISKTLDLFDMTRIFFRNEAIKDTATSADEYLNGKTLQQYFDETHEATPTDIKSEGNEVFLVHDTKELAPQTRLKLKTINGQSVIGDGNISAGGGEQEYIAIVMDGEITTAEGHRLTATLPEEVTYDELFNDPTKKIRLDFHFKTNHLYLYFVPALMNEANHYIYGDIIHQGNDYFNVYVAEDKISVSWKSSVQTLEISGIDIGANETITYEIQNSDVVQSIRSIRCTTTPDENYLYGMPHKNESGKWIIQIMNLTAYSQSSQTFNVIYSEV